MQIPPGLFDFISAVSSFIITLCILSYLFFGDNVLFRIVVYIFVGAAAGYVAAVAWSDVLYPALVQPFLSGVAYTDPAQMVSLIFLIPGSLLLLFKLSPRLSHLGQLPMAYLVGVGAAVTLGGAVLGTLLPQINATFNGFDLISSGVSGAGIIYKFLNGLAVLLGVIGTLVYFHFGATPKTDGTVHRNPLVNILAWVGRVFIAVTFGVLFAGVYMAALIALIQRMDSIRSLFFQ